MENRSASFDSYWMFRLGLNMYKICQNESSRHLVYLLINVSTPWCCLFAWGFFHADHACYSLSLPGLNSFPPLSESSPKSCDANWERFSPPGWVLGKEVSATARLHLLCPAPCWLTLFVPGKDNQFGFSVAVCYFVQGRCYCCGGSNIFCQGKSLLKWRCKPYVVLPTTEIQARFASVCTLPVSLIPAAGTLVEEGIEICC